MAEQVQMERTLKDKLSSRKLIVTVIGQIILAIFALYELLPAAECAQ